MQLNVFIEHYCYEFYSSHSPIYSVLTVLLETQSETAVKIYTVSSNEAKNIKIKETERIETSIRFYDK